MQIVRDYPPNYLKIKDTLHPPANAIYCYGDKIYAPGDGEVTPELIVHEQVHCDRQGDAIEEWWDEYIYSPQFRLAEELPAHRAEYQAYLTRVPALSRPQRRRILKILAKRLSGPLYGKLISFERAKAALKGDASG